MNNNDELEMFEVDLDSLEMESKESMELSDEELEGIIGGRNVPGSQVVVNQSTAKQWSTYFKNGNTVMYRGQRWNVNGFQYMNGRFYTFCLRNPQTNAYCTYVPAKDVIVSVK